jgi:alkylation response protein AidB-like acyl-CoA dehydrogenase
MALVLNDEQRMVKDSADGFFAEHGPVSQLRKLRDAKDADGFDRGLWAKMAEMGFAGQSLACPAALASATLAGSCTGYGQGGARVTDPIGIGNAGGALTVVHGPKIGLGRRA